MRKTNKELYEMVRKLQTVNYNLNSKMLNIKNHNEALEKVNVLALTAFSRMNELNGLDAPYLVCLVLKDLRDVFSKIVSLTEFPPDE